VRAAVDRFAQGLVFAVVVLLAGTGYATDADTEYATRAGDVAEFEFDGIPIALPQVFFWVRTELTNDGVLRLKPVSVHESSGEIDVLVTSNVALEFSCSIVPIYKEGTSDPVIRGDYSCSVTPSSLEAPGGRITIHATIKNMDNSGVVPGPGCLTVASVTLKVRPRVAW
jgi:hypothetical protein